MVGSSQNVRSIRTFLSTFGKWSSLRAEDEKGRVNRWDASRMEGVLNISHRVTSDLTCAFVILFW